MIRCARYRSGDIWSFQTYSGVSYYSSRHCFVCVRSILGRGYGSPCEAVAGLVTIRRGGRYRDASRIFVRVERQKKVRIVLRGLWGGISDVIELAHLMCVFGAVVRVCGLYSFSRHSGGPRAMDPNKGARYFDVSMTFSSGRGTQRLPPAATINDIVPFYCTATQCD